MILQQLLRPILSQVRLKTFRKQPSKAFKRVVADIKYRKALSLPPRPDASNLTETKFFKVVGNMKIYKPLSPGLTNRRHPTRFHLHKGSCIHRLSVGKRSTGGRNCSGRITVRHRGGGHKKRIRLIDFHRSTPGEYKVERFEYDPNRTGELMLLRHICTNELSYVIRTANVLPGDILYSFAKGVPIPGPGQKEIAKSELAKDGNCLPISQIPVGSYIHCIGLKPLGPAKMCRSAGTSAQILSTSPNGYAQLRMGSMEIRMVHADSIATIGKVANEAYKLRNWGKAGARRRKGWRPSVRGIAMNPRDHPHGGGRKNKGGKAARSPWGWLTKGPKTVRRKRWFIITPRWKAKRS